MLHIQIIIKYFSIGKPFTFVFVLLVFVQSIALLLFWSFFLRFFAWSISLFRRLGNFVGFAYKLEICKQNLAKLCTPTTYSDGELTFCAP